jgi:small subunit ribosomal protein S11
MAKGTQQQNSAKAAAKKRIVKVDAHGDVHVTASFNNIIIVYKQARTSNLLE